MTNTKTNHTPGPWTLDSANGIKDADGYVFTYPIGDNIEAREIGEKIIRAVNSHDELLEACKISLERFEQDGWPLNDLNITAINKLKKAIAKSERES